MSKLFFLILLFLSFFLVQCVEKNEIVSPTDDSQSGKILLKVDKANAPTSVTIVEATLSRESYDSISTSLNLLSDSTADFEFDEIFAGTWHLQVDAKDSNDVVLYTGETNVEVFAGFVTQVNLTLNPTGEGTGSIYIFVTWGQHKQDWIDFVNNPVLSTAGNYWDYSGVQQSKVLYINGTYRMYYTAQGPAYSGYIGLAYSNDGVTWTRNSDLPVLSPSANDAWDSYAVAGATVINDENGYKMYYTGWSNSSSGGEWPIGLAVSTDGISWEKNQTPVLYGSGSGWEYQIAPSSIIKVEGDYYLYYYGRNPYQIGLATSSDGVNWTKNQSNPILKADHTWEGAGVYFPSVYKDGSQFVMYYMNASGTGFGKAVSSDGINWVKDSNDPIILKDDTHNQWANYKIAYPNFIKMNNHDVIYYTGFDYNSPPKIGFISK